MKLNRLIASGLLATSLLAAGGCAASQTPDSSDSFALTTLGPVELPAPSAQDGFHLGAGDTLGQHVFDSYVKFVYAESPVRR